MISDKERITLSIYQFIDCSKQLIMNNLPSNISNLVIDIDKKTHTPDLEGLFTNLPFNLKKIKFKYKFSLFDIDKDATHGIFNLVFGIKVPFGCKIIIVYGGKNYTVKYISNKQLQIVKKVKAETNFFYEIKKINYIEEHKNIIY